MTVMQDSLVLALRKDVLCRAADEEDAWGEQSRPEIAAVLREQADSLE